MTPWRVAVDVNGVTYERTVEPRLLLSDFIRHEAGLTGTHVGCEHGVCGSCTVQLDGAPIRSCLLLAVQAHGHAVRTVESLVDAHGRLHPVQEALKEARGLQCGFCTAGFLMTIESLLRRPDVSELDDAQVRHELAGNLCRCTGYQGIVDAVRRLAAGDRQLDHPAPTAPTVPARTGGDDGH